MANEKATRDRVLQDIEANMKTEPGPFLKQLMGVICSEIQSSNEALYKNLATIFDDNVLSESEKTDPAESAKTLKTQKP